MATRCFNCSGRGYLHPVVIREDAEYDYVTRCEECGVYENDYQAAQALARESGMAVRWAILEDLDGEPHHQPYLEG